MTPEILARYLSGNASPADRAAVEAWAQSTAANAGDLVQLRTVWTPQVSPSEDWNVDRAWNRVWPQLSDGTPVTPLFRRPAVWMALAATVILAAGAAWRATRPTDTLYQTAVGQQQRVTLSDGSTVDLAPGSRLEVKAGYGRPGRTVTLSGRGMFEVRHDAGHPFRVIASGTTMGGQPTPRQLRSKSRPMRVNG